MAHRIYAAEIQRLGPVGVIVTTAYFNAGGYARAEFFVLIPGEEALRAKDRLSFDVKSFHDSPIELNEDFMLDEALLQAKVCLSTYLEERYANTPHLIPPSSPPTLERDLNLLVHMWVRGDSTLIQEMYRTTEYEPLQDALRPIQGLPSIRRDSL